jgi:hypothetical protein
VVCVCVLYAMLFLLYLFSMRFPFVSVILRGLCVVLGLMCCGVLRPVRVCSVCFVRAWALFDMLSNSKVHSAAHGTEQPKSKAIKTLTRTYTQQYRYTHRVAHNTCTATAQYAAAETHTLKHSRTAHAYSTDTKNSSAYSNTAHKYSSTHSSTVLKI